MPELLYTYDPITGEYRNATTGDPVSDDDLRAADEALIAALTLLLLGLTRELQAGSIDLAAWQLQMMAQLKAGHLAVGAAGYGGLAELSPSRLAVIETRLQTEFGYLDAWARGLVDGTAPLDDRMLVRAGLYGQAVRGTAGDIAGRQAALHGADEERNVLDAKESCRGCLAATRAGWVKIGTLPPIGQRICLANCKCSIIYRSRQEAA
jgi:hypothetical protein